MKKFYLLLFVGLLYSVISFAQTNGQLNITFSTSNAGGNYSPRNILAVWIEDENGMFVKTLMAYAVSQITHLNTWQSATTDAGTEFNVVDAITGSTRNSHANRECSWNGLDYNQNSMPDGLYYVWMELTDKNGTGNFSSFEFTKGDTPTQITPTNVPSFSNIDIIWTPSGIGIAESKEKDPYIIFNNPSSNGVFEINTDKFDKILITSISGRYVDESKSKIIDLSAQPKGVYLLHIYKDDKQYIKKVICQ